MRLLLLLLLLLSIVYWIYVGLDLEINEKMSISEKIWAYIKWGIGWLSVIYFYALLAFAVYMKCTGKWSEPERDYDEEEIEYIMDDPMRHVPGRYQ